MDQSVDPDQHFFFTPFLFSCLWYTQKRIESLKQLDNPWNIFHPKAHLELYIQRITPLRIIEGINALA